MTLIDTRFSNNQNLCNVEKINKRQLINGKKNEIKALFRNEPINLEVIFIFLVEVILMDSERNVREKRERKKHSGLASKT